VAQLERALPQAIEMAQKQLDAAQFTQKAAELQFERIKSLYEDARGLASQRDFEVATMTRDKETAEVLKAEAALIKTELDTNAALESLQASMESARSDLSKAEKEWTELQIKINQTGRQVIEAPRDGAVVRLQVNEGTYLKTGTPLCTIVPETKNLVGSRCGLTETTCRWSANASSISREISCGAGASSASSLKAGPPFSLPAGPASPSGHSAARSFSSTKWTTGKASSGSRWSRSRT